MYFCWSVLCSVTDFITVGTELRIIRSVILTVSLYHVCTEQSTNRLTDQESLKQWSNVLGLTTSKTASNVPQSGYTQTIYGEGDSNTAKLVGYSGQGVGHSVPAHESNEIAFFGL